MFHRESVFRESVSWWFFVLASPDRTRFGANIPLSEGGDGMGRRGGAQERGDAEAPSEVFVAFAFATGEAMASSQGSGWISN